MNKIRIIVGACGIHLCIGSVYAWSVLVNPIMQKTGWGLFEVTSSFCLAILFLGLSAAFTGKQIRTWGPKRSSATAMLFYITGTLGSALAIELNNLFLLYLFYGIIGGIGLGIGYVAPLATLMKWFPESKGFAGGCAVMAFGFAAIIASPVMSFIVYHYGLIANFILMSVGFALIMSISIWLIKPADDQNPIFYEPSRIIKMHTFGMSPSEAVRTKDYWIIWITLFINIAAGLAILSIASPIAEHLIDMTRPEAAGLVAMIALLNGGGRIFFAAISDFIGRINTYKLIYVIESIAFIILGVSENDFMIQCVILVIAACYGGVFSCMPALISDVFGNKHLTEIHGRMLTSWGFAGIAGPLIMAASFIYTDDYDMLSVIFSLLFLLSIWMISYIRKPI